MRGKRIVLAVTGGIAVYKAAELVRRLLETEAEVRVGMTRNATRFVTALTFETLSGQTIISDMWEAETGLTHISMGQEADLIIVAPATANFIAKMAHGLADDFLSTMLLAATAPVLVCPAMNSRMYAHPSVVENLAILQRRGVTVVAPGEGSLACRTAGPGRLPEPDEIVEQARAALTSKDLAGVRILVTAGPTEEPLDPVRFLSNRSSGKMGFALAGAAVRRGAAVTLISGPTPLPPPAGVLLQRVRTAEEMFAAVTAAGGDQDAIIKAAAVSDYRPAQTAPHKIKKGGEALSLQLRKTPDILAELGKHRERHGAVLVGFAAETEDLLENARKKLAAKQLDLVVANDVSRRDAGFAADTNQVKLISPDGSVEESPLMPKNEAADLILDRVKALLDARERRAR